jgi:hypothetical protein
LPKCKKCEKDFRNFVTIDGLIRNLCRRKYCLECSPFGKHNTKRLDVVQEAVKEGEILRICTHCSREFIVDRKKGLHGHKCNSCNTNAQRHKRKIKCIEYKGSKCEICGYSKCVGALVFHHLNTEEKEFNIGGSHCRSWEKTKKELDKCMLLCSNCHQEIHYYKSEQTRVN